MNITFYHNNSDSRYSIKDLTELESTTGAFKQPFNILDPVLQLSKAINPLEYNYVYIPEVSRYYFVASRPLYEAGYYNVTLHSDVISNFRSQYINLGAIIARQESKYNAYLKDSKLPVLNKQDINTIAFPRGFNNTDELLMVVNGG